MTIYYKASLIIVLFLAMAACSVASHHHGGVRGAANNNTDQHHHHHRDHHHHHHHHDIHKDTDAVGVHTKDRFLGSISCENTVETLLVIDGDGPDDWTEIPCLSTPFDGINCLQFDGLSRRPIWTVCPLMCPNTGCLPETPAPSTPSFEDEPFVFKCENQVPSVMVHSSKDDETQIEVRCKNTASTNTDDEYYCKQFDRITRKVVWSVCPLFCSYTAFTVCDAGCINKVETLVVLGGKDNEETRHVKCTNKPGKNSRYCAQFNGATQNLVWMDCPLMCPQSACN